MKLENRHEYECRSGKELHYILTQAENQDLKWRSGPPPFEHHMIDTLIDRIRETGAVYITLSRVLGLYGLGYGSKPSPLYEKVDVGSMVQLIGIDSVQL